MKFTDLLNRGFKVVKSITLDSLTLITGGIAGLVIWRAAQGVEVALRCGCGDCFAQKLWPFGIDEIFFSGRCACGKHCECKVTVTSTLANLVTGLDIYEMLEVKK